MRRAFEHSPVLDAALEGAQLPIGKASEVSSLQVEEEGLGLQAGVDLQFASHLVPYVGEGVFACAPGVIRLNLAGELAESSVLAGGLLVHAGLGGGSGEGRLLVDEHEEATDLLVGNHPGWGLLKEAQQGNAER